MRPIETCRKPTPSGADGHATRTQLPSSRVTGNCAPRAAWPITGLPVLGDL